MASIRERVDASGKSKWHAQVRLLGFPTQTKTFTRKTDAKAWTEETERLMKTGRFLTVNESQRRTISELFEVFKRDYMRESRRKDYTQILGWWEERLGRLHLANVKAPAIQKCLEGLQFPSSTSVAPTKSDCQDGVAPKNKPRSAGTVLRYLAVLSRVMTVAVNKLEWLEKSPIAGVERPVGQTEKIVRTVNAEEERVLLAAAAKSENRFLKAIILIALRSGMRYSEIMNLRWGDIEFRQDEGLMTLRKTKNKRQRIVPLVRDALAAVDALRHEKVETATNDLLFPSGDKRDNRDKPVEIRQAWQTCLKRAGIKNLRFHDLRHSAASRYAGLGYSYAEIAEILGHADHRSTQIYTHFDKGHTIKMAKHAADAALAADSQAGASGGT